MICLIMQQNQISKIFHILKTEVDKLGIDKLAPALVNLSKLSDIVKNDVVKKTVYGKLVEKVNKIDTSGFVSKTKYSEFEKEILDISSLVKKTSYNSKVNTLAKKTELSIVGNKTPSVNKLVTKADFNTKVTEIKGKIPDITDLATKTASNAGENKIPSVSNLVKKLKIIEIEKKINDHNQNEYVTTQEFNILTAKSFTSILKQADLVTETDFDDKLKSFNKNINSNKTKHLLVWKWN